MRARKPKSPRRAACRLRVKGGHVEKLMPRPLYPRETDIERLIHKGFLLPVCESMPPLTRE